MWERNRGRMCEQDFSHGGFYINVQGNVCAHKRHSMCLYSELVVGRITGL